MTLKEHYNVNKRSKLRRLKGLTFLILIVLIYFSISSTFARYARVYDSYVEANIANWNFTINGVKLTSAESSLGNSVSIPMQLTTRENKDNPNLINPSQEGYFELVIDPTNTEVSFQYETTIDFTNTILPSHFKIASYQSKGQDSPSDTSQLGFNSSNTTKKVTGKKYIQYKNAKNQIFGPEDKITIKYFWTWVDAKDEDRRATDKIEFQIKVNIKLKQIVSG